MGNADLALYGNEDEQQSAGTCGCWGLIGLILLIIGIVVTAWQKTEPALTGSFNSIRPIHRRALLVNGHVVLRALVKVSLHNLE
jgi:glucose uptake protein GlcU